jgi:hypothetical protein
MWFRNKRRKGKSRWHWDDTPQAPGFMKVFSQDLSALPLSICKTANRMIMFDETQEDQPSEAECCPLCLKELAKREVPTLF